MKRLRFGIIPKLTLVFVLFAAVLLMGIGVLAFENARSALQAAMVSELLSTAIEKQATLDAWVADREADLVSIAYSTHLRDEVANLIATRDPSAPKAAPDHVVEELRNWVGAAHDIRELLVIAPEDGKVLAATDAGEEGKFKEDRLYFVNGKKGVYVQNPYYDLVLQGPTMTIAAPILSSDGRLLAVLAGYLDMQRLNAIINQRTGLHRTDDAFLVNTSNLFVTQPRLATDPAVLQRGIHTAAIERCLARSSGTIAAADYRGVPALIVYRWLPERQLCLEVTIDQAEAFTPVRSLGGTLLITSIFVLLLASALAFLLARTITRPVLAMQIAASRLGRGELHVHLPETGRDELGALAREFNTMAGSLSEKDAQLRANATNLERTVAERTADLERSNKELEQFAYVASHDLQEPLRMVASYVQLLQRRYQGKLDQDADEFIAFAVDGATRMQRLINDLLAFSRVGTRGRDLVAMSSETALAQALASLDLFIEENHARVTHDPLPPVLGDEEQLAQLFQNLVNNAVKFHGEAAPEVHIGAERVVGSGAGATPMWQFSVRDNGIGIDAQYFDRIFIIFQRLHSRDSYAGTGIGLAICKKIVERHGGRIWVESQPGQGTTFLFTLRAEALREGENRSHLLQHMKE